MDGSFRVPLDYELLVQHVYETLLQPGDAALDVGAHLGRHTFPMAHCVGPDGRILAFEPLPACRSALEKELHDSQPDLVSRVEIHSCALGAEPGQSEFVVAVDLPSYSGLRERIYDQPTRLERIPIVVQTIDQMTASWPALRLIKVDAEGGELDILRGGRQTLRRLRPVVVFEFGERALGNYDATAADMFDLLLGLDYDLYGIDGRRLDAASFADSAREQKIYDYVAVPAEDRDAHLAVEETLHDQAIRLLQIRSVLTFASMQAQSVGQVPAMNRFPAILRPPARYVASWVMSLAGVFLNPQRRANDALITALATTLDALTNVERRLQAANRRARHQQEKGAESVSEDPRRISAA